MGDDLRTILVDSPFYSKLLCIAALSLTVIHFLRIDIGVDDLVDPAGSVDAGGIDFPETIRGVVTDKRGTAHASNTLDGFTQ